MAKLLSLAKQAFHHLFSVIRSDGTLDTTFGEDSGVVYFNYRDHFGYSDDPVRSSSARNVAIQQDGSILMVGSCPMNHDEDILSDDVDVFLSEICPRWNH